MGQHRVSKKTSKVVHVSLTDFIYFTDNGNRNGNCQGNCFFNALGNVNGNNNIGVDSKYVNS